MRSSIKIVVNEKQLNNFILDKLRIAIRPRLNRLARSVFANAKADLIKEVMEDPISKELNGGANGSNLTGLVPTGNLFSFIGFPVGSRPVQELISFLNENINMADTPTYGRNGTFGIFTNFKVTLPTRSQFRTALPFPEGWSAESWVLGIENGISGLPYFLKTNSGKSRSGGGLQTQSVIRNVEFKPQSDYITKKLESFVNRLKYPRLV